MIIKMVNRHSKLLRRITGGFTVIGIVSLLYSLIRGDQLNVEAIYLTVTMFAGYVYFNAETTVEKG